MRARIVSSLLAIVWTVGLSGVSLAEDKAPSAPATEKAPPPAAKGKPVTLSGVMTCAKCALGEGTSCQNVLKVGKAGAEEKYYLAKNDVSEQNHEAVCGGEAKATIKGTVSEEGGKKVLTASSIKVKK